jgi:hypothetical protein
MALDGDRGELRTIKRELDELRHVSLLQEAGVALSTATTTASTNTANTSAHTTTNTAAAIGGGGGAPATADSTNSSVNSSGSSGGNNNKSDELQRLVQWREDLRQAGGYDEGHPILSQLTRQIQLLQR